MPSDYRLQEGRETRVRHAYLRQEREERLSPREYEAFFDLSKQLFQLSTDAIEKLIRERGWKNIENVEGEEDL